MCIKSKIYNVTNKRNLKFLCFSGAAMFLGLWNCSQEWNTAIDKHRLPRKGRKRGETMLSEDDSPPQSATVKRKKVG